MDKVHDRGQTFYALYNKINGKYSRDHCVYWEVDYL